MKKTHKILLFIYILISIASYSYASYTSYEAEEYILKIENINEKIQKIDLVSFEECEMEDVGHDYQTTFEIVSLFDKDPIIKLDKHDTENYHVKPIVRYNYLSGKAAQDIEHTVVSGKYDEYADDGKLITYDLAINQKFSNEFDFYQFCSVAKENEFICVKTTKYKSYKITPVKELGLSLVANNKLTYNHDDFSNLKIGIRIKNEMGEYKTFISNDNSMIMFRYGGKPIIDKEKITIFDYQDGTYKDNSQYSFKVPVKTGSGLILMIIILSSILVAIVIALIIIYIISKKKKVNK